MRVREPAADGNCVLRMENVRRRGVVDDDGLSKVAANLREVLLWISPIQISLG